MELAYAVFQVLFQSCVGSLISLCYSWSSLVAEESWVKSSFGCFSRKVKSS